MTGRVWVYVRDDRPFGGRDPPAALFYASRDRTREHPEGHLSGYAGILQADAFDGYNRLYLPDRKPGPIVEALCWSHARRKFFELADIAANARRVKTATPISPIALEAVRRIDALFDVEREINGLSAARRLAARQERSVPLVGALEGWMRAERVKLSRHAAVAKAIDYTVTRWPSFTRFLDDGRICLSNNAAERVLARAGDGAFIVHLIFKCLETLEAAPWNWSDTGCLSGRSPRRRLSNEGRLSGFDRERPARLVPRAARRCG